MAHRCPSDRTYKVSNQMHSGRRHDASWWDNCEIPSNINAGLLFKLPPGKLMILDLFYNQFAQVVD